ncbi:RNA polymerase sigma factor [Sorangium sp. So ce119]|uniref:RNA polymerase sigma factor n=1 Tax=Sorangium sp. So ce119 TaxID=3133279 RepID=UPI003F6389F1
MSASFDALVRCHRAVLYRRALRLTGNETDAADLVQDTLERAMRRLPSDLSEPDACAWLHATMRNLFFDRRRAYEHRCRTDLTEEALSSLPSPDPEEQPEWCSLPVETLRDGIEQLERPLREVMMLKFEVGLSQMEIAGRLNIPPATVGTRVFRAKKKLRILLFDKTPGRRGKLREVPETPMTSAIRPAVELT